jgi:RNA 2',3'-cyclic 3'-phosphodiesterase
VRVFVAVEPSEAVRAWVAGTAAQLQSAAPGLRWVAAENAHWTLAFLGDQPDEKLPELREAMREAAKASAPFAISMGGLGAFDSWRRARVVWVGLAAGEDKMGALAGALREALEARGFPIERREFSAHLTLARAREPKRLEALAEEKLRALPPPMLVSELALMRSFLSPKGARYERVWGCSIG